MKTAVHSLLVLSLCSGLFCLAPHAFAQGGVPLWTNSFSSGGINVFLAADYVGNIFVAAGGGVVKYSNAGVPLWTNSFPEGQNPYLGIDRVGNVFVATGVGTIKYSNAGVPLWTNFNSGFMAFDSSGNLFLTGGFVTTAYSGLGIPLWTNGYVGASWAIAVDSGGNVLVTGQSDTSDYATIKYSNTGVPIWTNLYSGPATSFDIALAIAADSSGNVFVSGSSVETNFLNSDFVTIKYSTSGVPLWTNRYNGAPNNFEDVTAVAVDTTGNVFVAGNSGGDYALIKYSNAGAGLWTRRYNGPANAADGAYAMGLDSVGNVFVTGISESNSSSDDYATLGYSNAGASLWTRRYNGTGNGSDGAYAMAVDRIGNVFVAGSSWNGTSSDYVTIKYSSSVPLPRLDFQKLNNQIVLNWTNAGFNLQSAPLASGSFTNIPGATSPYTNSLLAPRQFFRLISN